MTPTCVVNITCQIDNISTTLWEQWVRDIMCNWLLTTECFKEFHFYQLAEDIVQKEKTYVLQCIAMDKASVSTFFMQHKDSLQSLLSAKWQENCLHFASAMYSVK
jgi:hypothetical protein